MHARSLRTQCRARFAQVNMLLCSIYYFSYMLTSNARASSFGCGIRHGASSVEMCLCVSYIMRALLVISQCLCMHGSYTTRSMLWNLLRHQCQANVGRYAPMLTNAQNHPCDQCKQFNQGNQCDLHSLAQCRPTHSSVFFPMQRNTNEASNANTVKDPQTCFYHCAPLQET